MKCVVVFDIPSSLDPHHKDNTEGAIDDFASEKLGAGFIMRWLEPNERFSIADQVDPDDECSCEDASCGHDIMGGPCHARAIYNVFDPTDPMSDVEMCEHCAKNQIEDTDTWKMERIQ